MGECQHCLQNHPRTLIYPGLSPCCTPASCPPSPPHFLAISSLVWSNFHGFAAVCVCSKTLTAQNAAFPGGMLLGMLQDGKGRAGGGVGRGIPMLGPRHRGWRSLLCSERPHVQGLLLPADFPSFYPPGTSFNVFQERAGGPSEVNKVRTLRDMPRQDQAASSIPGQGAMVQHVLRTAAPSAMALSKKPNAASQSRDRGPRVSRGWQQRSYIPPQTSLRHRPLQHPAANCHHGDAEGPVPAGHP